MPRKFEVLAKEVSPGKVVGGGDCNGGQCPAVLACDDGSLVIVGNRLSADEMNALAEAGNVKVYDHEFAIKLNPELIRMVAGKV